MSLMDSLLKNGFTSSAETMQNRLDRAILQGVPLAIPVGGLEAGMKHRASATPDQYGVIADRAKLNFAEIASCTDRLAHILQTHYGVGPGVVVGLFLPRNQWVPVAMAAVLKAGGAFVAFDPAAPEARLTYMLRDSGTKLLLVTPATTSRLPTSVPKIADITALAQQSVSEFVLEANTDPRTPAYIVYTSGSTGVPKGVLIERQAVVNLIYALEQVLYQPLGSRVRELLSAPFIFDAAIQQCLSCLVTGNELHILNEIVRRDPVQFLRYVREHDIQVINVVTPFLLALLDHGLAETPPPTLKHIVTGGEAVAPALIERLYACEASRHLTLTNMYGPAENCTDSTYFPITAGFTSVAGKVPIGYPLPNTRVYILDAEQRPVQPDTVGEISVAGAGVAQGYVNQPELTASRFIPDPFYPGERAYRTGDMGLITSAGHLLFVGRDDEQIKIRGYRIELGEINAALLALEGVKEAAVIVQRNGSDAALIAFVATNGSVDKDVLRCALTKRLPDYMIPSQIHLLDRLPHNLTGKIDVKTLEKLALELQTATDNVPPTNPIEQSLLDIWRDVLGSHVKGITDNFFFLGGHSLKAAQITGRIQARLGMELTIADLYQHPTIKALAALIHQCQIKPLEQIPPVEDQHYYPLSHAQQCLWLICQMEGGSQAYNVPLVWDVSNVDIAALGDALTLVVRRHEALRTGFITVDSVPQQFVVAPEDTHILPVIHDLTTTPDAGIQVETIINREANTVFQLEAPPLLRLVVLRLPGETWRLLLTFHHLVVDGWSLMILFDEINHAYDKLRLGYQPILPSISLQYRDYAAWHTQQNFESAIAYWLQQLAGAPPELALPIDPEDNTESFRGGSVERQLDPSLVQRLERFAQTDGITLASLLLSLFLLLLAKFTQQSDICVGMGVAGRTHPQLEQLVGLMVNTLPIRVQITDAMTFAELTQQVARTIAEALTHQEAPLDEVIRRLNPPRRPGRQPLFNVLFAFQSFEEVRTSHEASLLDPNGLERLFFDTAKVDLSLFVNRRDQSLLLSLEYRSSCLRAQTCQRLLAMLEQLAHQVVVQEEQP